MQIIKQSILEVYCLALFITSAVTLPTLSGPTNQLATSSSSHSSSSSTGRKSSSSSRSSSSSSSKSSSSSSSSQSSSFTSIKRSSTVSSSSRTSLSTSSISFTSRETSGPGGASSTSSAKIASSTGSASKASASTGTVSTGHPTSLSVINSSHSHWLSSSTLPSTGHLAPSGSDNSRPPLAGTTGGQNSSVISATGQSHPTASSGGSRPSSAISSTPSTLGTSVSSKLVPTISITNASALGAFSISVAPSPSANACGPVAQYYNPTPQNWTDNNLDVWLNTWVGNNVAPIAANPNGFTGAFATWAIGNPDFTCRDDGSATNCDFDPCNSPVLNSKGLDVRPTYYVMESLTRIHTYFQGLRESFTVSSIAAALSKDSWAETFYTDKDDKSVVALREVISALSMIVGIVSALSGLGGLVGTSFGLSAPATPENAPSLAGTIAAVSATLYNGASNSISPTLGLHQDDTFKKSADLGGILGDIVVGGIESFTSANNILMHGQNYQGSGDLRDYFRGGAFVDYPGIDKNAVTNTMNAFLIGQAINQLYRQQKIFILGGGACGDNQGIGAGPQGYSICRDGKAWYLYYWQENNVVSITAHQWGWVSPPPGSDQLGKGDYVAVTIQDIINSSLDAYIAAGYDYNNVTAYQRAQSAITQNWANPAAQGASWEGTFTIPVCDVSASIDKSYYDKYWILEDYGHDSRPVWCGPICNGDVQKTKAFIHAANMDNFESPRHLCDGETEAGDVWWT